MQDCAWEYAHKRVYLFYGMYLFAFKNYIVVKMAVIVYLNMCHSLNSQGMLLLFICAHHSRSHIGSAWLHWPLFKHCCTGSPTR